MDKDTITNNLKLYQSVDNLEKLIMHYIDSAESDPAINVNSLMIDFNNIKSFINKNMRTKDVN